MKTLSKFRKYFGRYTIIKPRSSLCSWTTNYRCETISSRVMISKYFSSLHLHTVLYIPLISPHTHTFTPLWEHSTRYPSSQLLNNITNDITFCKINTKYMLKHTKYKQTYSTTKNQRTKMYRDWKLNHPEKILVITRYKIPSGRTKTHISFQLPFAFSFPL